MPEAANAGDSALRAQRTNGPLYPGGARAFRVSGRCVWSRIDL